MRYGKAVTLGILVLLVQSACAERILFYEVSSSSSYMVEKDYSYFDHLLKAEGFDVATLTRGELTKETLENYDILVIQELNKDLTTQEISAIIWFVLNKGKGLFINGDGGGRANQLAVPFGMTIDDGVLFDTTDPIPGADDTDIFTIDKFEDYPELHELKDSVTKIGFYKGRGLKVSGDTMPFMRGDTDTFSDTGSFPSGSQPPVAAASLLGEGRVFLLTDADMLHNDNINQYHNRNLGMNIIKWLIAREEGPRPPNTRQELKLIWGEMTIEIDKMGKEKDELESVKKGLLKTNSRLEKDLDEKKSKVEDIESNLIGPFTKVNLAFMFLGVAIFAAAGISQKKNAGKKPKDKESGLSYEMGEGEEEDEEDEGFEEDVEEDEFMEG